MKKQTLLTAVVSVLAGSAIAGGIAWAAIGDGGVIQGCYDSGGNLKVVAAPPCPKGYTSLPWNQQGIAGPKGDKGDQGIQGPQGNQGETGPEGPQGQDGVSGYQIVSSSIVGIPPGVPAIERSVLCPPGKKALGGGWTVGSDAGVGIASLPTLSGQAWTVGIRNTSASETIDTQIFAICADVD